MSGSGRTGSVSIRRPFHPPLCNTQPLPSPTALVRSWHARAFPEAAAEFAIRNDEVARDATAALGGDDARAAIVNTAGEDAAQTLYTLPPVDPTTEEGAEILARRRERACVRQRSAGMANQVVSGDVVAVDVDGVVVDVDVLVVDVGVVM